MIVIHMPERLKGKVLFQLRDFLMAQHHKHLIGRRLRDELAQSRAANNDYMQSQYILGQLGRYYQNPPCNPCGCGG